MIEIHTTTTGQKLFISQMNDKHLQNTIKLLCRKIKKLRESVAAPPVVNSEKAAVYGISEVTYGGNVRAELPRIIRKLYPYLAEAFLREMSTGGGILNAVQEAMGRTDREDSLPVTPDTVTIADKDDEIEIDDLGPHAW